MSDMLQLVVIAIQGPIAISRQAKEAIAKVT